MEVPLLLIHFNRPEMTRRQIEWLSAVQPRRLYVLCDGAREGRPEDVERTEKVRRQFDSIPWECEIRRCYRDENLGVYHNISQGISWFFEQVEAGIILEDDCLPHASFFPYCDELLQRFAGVEQVTTISGYTGLETDLPINDSYCFSNYFSCWGWATWRRSWVAFDPDMNGFVDAAKWSEICRRLHPSFRQKLYWKYIFNRVFSGRTNSWAYRFLLSMWLRGGLAVVPKRNLIENTGFRGDATNTAWHEERETAVRAMDTPMKHPSGAIQPNLWFDRWTEDHCHSKSLTVRVAWLRKRIAARIRTA